MPELPEVETVRRTLEELIVGKEIRDVDVFWEKMIRNVTVAQFKEQLLGKTIDGIHRYGKHLQFYDRCPQRSYFSV